MAAFVALIRAIGPVTHAKMSMAALREGCEAAGVGDVTTYGNTGNLLCTSDQNADAVRLLVQGVVNGFDLDNEVFIRTSRQLAAVVKANPFPTAASERPSALGVCSFHRAPRWPDWVWDYDGPEQLAVVGSHLCVAYPAGISASKLNLEKRLGVTMTERNWTTFSKLAERAAALAKG